MFDTRVARFDCTAVRLITLLLVWAAAACTLGRADPDYLMPAKRSALVREAAETFGSNLRWGRLEAAASVVHPQHRHTFLTRLQSTNPPLQFTSFDIVSLELGDRRDTVEVLVQFSLYQLPSVVERTVLMAQQWSYDPAAGRWWIEPDLDVFSSPTSRPTR